MLLKSSLITILGAVTIFNPQKLATRTALVILAIFIIAFTLSFIGLLLLPETEVDFDKILTRGVTSEHVKSYFREMVNLLLLFVMVMLGLKSFGDLK